MSLLTIFFSLFGFCHTCKASANTQKLFCLQTWWWWCISMVDTMKLSSLTFGESQLWEGSLAPWLDAFSLVFCMRGSSSSESSYSAMKWGSRFCKFFSFTIVYEYHLRTASYSTVGPTPVDISDDPHPSAGHSTESLHSTEQQARDTATITPAHSRSSNQVQTTDATSFTLSCNSLKHLYH